MHTTFASILVFFCLFSVSPAANSESTDQLAQEIAEIRRIAEAQGTNLATAMNQLQEVLAEFQRLHGQIDESQHKDKTIGKLIEDSQHRLDILEEKQNQIVTQLSEIKSVGLLPAEQSKKLEEFKQYSMALQKINVDEYKGAISSLTSFMTTYPKSLFVANAQYWIGESYYSMSDYPAAVAAYQKVIAKYPKSEKLATCMLKQGLAFFKMQSFEESKAFLSKLIAKYPQSSEASEARSVIEHINNLQELKKKEALEMQVTS